MTGRRLLRVLGLLCLILATLVALAVADVKWAAALLPGGLALWLASEV